MFRYAVVLALAAVALSGCTNDGDRAAAVAAELAQDIADRFDTAFDHPRDAEYLAAEIVLDDGIRRIELLDWAGESAGDDGARLDVRISVSLPETQTGGGFTTRTLQASKSVRCWSVTVSTWSHALRSIREFPCPDGATARIPDPEPLVELPDDIDAVLTTALEGATAADARSRVEELFPGEGYTIESAVQDGAVVVALGAPAVGDCVVAVIDADGVSVQSGFPWEALLPGEAGCSPGLLTMSSGA